MKKKGREYKVYVAVRLRPPLQRERGSPILVTALDQTRLRLQKTPKLHSDLQFDRVFSPSDTQRCVYDCLSPILLTNTLLQGRNATCFAYGQTGTGKTYTMLGEGDFDVAFDDAGSGSSPTSPPSATSSRPSASAGASSTSSAKTRPKRGLIPQTLEQLFETLAAQSRSRSRGASFDALDSLEGAEGLVADADAEVVDSDVDEDHLDIFGWRSRASMGVEDVLRGGGEDGPSKRQRQHQRRQQQEVDTDSDVAIVVSYLEIYNEKLYDLLNYDRKTPLDIREGNKSSMHVPGLRCIRVSSLSDVYELLNIGNRNRSIGVTDLNERSSRSHTVFQLLLAQRNFRSKLNLVDLAGSEKWDIFGKKGSYTDSRVAELTSINKSLSTLGKCIMLLRKGASHIPFRESKLTRLLQDSLGGNCLTAFVATISPSEMCFEETVSTLKFAIAAMHVVVNPIVNEVVDDVGMLTKLVERLQESIKQKEEKIKELLLKKNSSDAEGASFAALEERVERLKKIEVDQNRRQQELEQYHRWLYSVPVTRDPAGDKRYSMTLENRLILMERSMLHQVRKMEKKKEEFGAGIEKLRSEVGEKKEKLEVSRHVIRMQEEKIEEMGKDLDVERARVERLRQELVQVGQAVPQPEDDVDVADDGVSVPDEASKSFLTPKRHGLQLREHIVDLDEDSAEMDDWLKQNEVIFREIKEKIMGALRNSIELFQNDVVFLLREHVREVVKSKSQQAGLVEEMQQLVEGCTEGLEESVLQKQNEYNSVLFGLVRGRKKFRRVKVLRPEIPTSDQCFQTPSKLRGPASSVGEGAIEEDSIGTFHHVHQAVALCLASVREGPEMRKGYDDLVMQKSNLRNSENELFVRSKSIRRAVVRVLRIVKGFEEVQHSEFRRLKGEEDGKQQEEPSQYAVLSAELHFETDRVKERLRALIDELKRFELNSTHLKLESGEKDADDAVSAPVVGDVSRLGHSRRRKNKNTKTKRRKKEEVVVVQKLFGHSREDEPEEPSSSRPKKKRSFVVEMPSTGRSGIVDEVARGNKTSKKATRGQRAPKRRTRGNDRKKKGSRAKGKTHRAPSAPLRVSSESLTFPTVPSPSHPMSSKLKERIRSVAPDSYESVVAAIEHLGTEEEEVHEGLPDVTDDDDDTEYMLPFPAPSLRQGVRVSIVPEEEELSDPPQQRQLTYDSIVMSLRQPGGSKAVKKSSTTWSSRHLEPDQVVLSNRPAFGSALRRETTDSKTRPPPATATGSVSVASSSFHHRRRRRRRPEGRGGGGDKGLPFRGMFSGGIFSLGGDGAEGAVVGVENKTGDAKKMRKKRVVADPVHDIGLVPEGVPRLKAPLNRKRKAKPKKKKEWMMMYRDKLRDDYQFDV